MNPFDILDDATYRVTLARPVSVGTMRLLPRDRHKMQGETLRAIVSAEGWEAVVDARL